MQEHQPDINLKLSVLKSEIEDRLNHINSKYDLNLFPENAGLIIAAEEVIASCNLGGNSRTLLMSAAWGQVKTAEELSVIRSQIEDPYRLILKSDQEIKKSVQALGLFISRVIIDYKHLYSDKPEFHYQLLRSLLETLGVLIQAYELETDEHSLRTINCKYFLETYLDNAVPMLKFIKDFAKDSTEERNLEQCTQAFTELQKYSENLSEALELTSEQAKKIHQLLSMIYFTPPSTIVFTDSFNDLDSLQINVESIIKEK